MVNISSSNFTNIATKLTNIGKEGEAPNALYEINCIITVIINSIACPLTVLLNVLVIMAVKRRPRLQNNTNILLACLAATDVFTGLIVQPSFIVWKIYELLCMTESKTLFDRFSQDLYTSRVCLFFSSSDVSNLRKTYCDQIYFELSCPSHKTKH